MSYHDQLKRRALKAVRALHADTSVSQQTTVDDLQELQDEIDMMIDSTLADIERENQVSPEAADGPDRYSDYREP